MEIAKRIGLQEKLGKLKGVNFCKQLFDELVGIDSPLVAIHHFAESHVSGRL